MSGWAALAERVPWVAAAVVACAAAACDASRQGSAHDGGRSDMRADAGYVVLGACEPTLASLQTVVFEHTCAWDFCHGDQAAFGLRLLAPDVEHELVNAAAGSCPGLLRVVPGDPEHSLLYQKITLDHPPCNGHRMPDGLGPLAPSTVRCVRDWIESLTPGSGSGPDATPH